MNDLISVVVPVYRVEDYLNKCVNSIQNQVYKNLEIILVDDGSPDNCGVICDKLAQEDDRIKVIHQDNGGLSNARNSGIKKANGDYIAFIDSDDWIDENYINELYSRMINSNSELAICGIRYLDENGSTSKVVLPGKDGVFSNIDTIKSMHGEHRTPYVSAWAKLYKKELFEQVLFPDGKIHEDEFTCYRYIYNSKNIAIINEPLYNTVFREGSITTSKYTCSRLDILEALYDRIEFFQERDELKDQIIYAIKDFYGSYAYGISRIIPNGELEKSRICEVKQMARVLKHNYSSEIGIKGRIAFSFPKVYLLLLYIRNKIIKDY